MKKLKQLSALLLIVSFLLSIFSFSASAAGKTVNLHIVPKLCGDDEKRYNEKLNFDGSNNNNVGGKIVPGAKFKLYKIEGNGADSSKSYRVYEFPYINSQKQQRDVKLPNGETRSFWSNDNNPIEVITDNYGDGTISIDEKNFGWYCVVMDDIDGKKVCEPVVIYVGTNNDVKDIFTYIKLVEVGEELPTIKKYIMKDKEKFITKTAKQGETIKYRLDVGMPKLFGYYPNEDAFKNALSDRYSVFKVHDGLLRFNQIVNRDDPNQYPVKVSFVDGKGQKKADLNALNNNNENDSDFWIDQANGKDIIVDFRRGLKLGTQQDRDFSDNVAKLLYENRNDNGAHFEIEFEVAVNDLVQYFEEVNPNNEQNYQEQNKDVKKIIRLPF